VDKARSVAELKNEDRSHNNAVGLGLLGALSRYHKQLALRQILHHDKARTVKRLGRLIPDLKYALGLDFLTTLRKSFFGTSARIMARHAEALVMLKDMPEKQLFRYYR
jgi:hypothetical protein